MIPFIVNDWMWRTGVGGSIPSMIAYVLGVIGIYRLIRARLSRNTAVIAAAIYSLNPNLLYMQSTAMTESIFLATVIWSVVYLDDFVSAMSVEDAAISDRYPPHKSLEKCAMVLAAAILTRYDGWVLAAICGLIVVVVLVRHWSSLDAPLKRTLLRSTVAFCLLCALTAVLWLSLNYANTANPFDFANGPYSAKAIEARTMQLGQPGHPGTGDLWVSALFFMKTAKLNMAWGAWERWVWAFTLIGTVLVLRTWKSHGALLILWFVLPFYAYSRRLRQCPHFRARLVAALLLQRVPLRTRTPSRIRCLPRHRDHIFVVLVRPQGRALRHNRSLPPIDRRQLLHRRARNTHLPSRSPRQLRRPYPA